MSQPGFFKRFLREAQVGEQVQHENVVRTYDCDATEADGKLAHFIVMEYVEGQTLRELIGELERIPEELCRHIGRAVARGLSAIHEAGVLHRDVKPENVLITEDHVVKVMDLGVARLQEEAIRLSRAGDFVGTLEYAAPEQFRAADGEPDGRVDLYALGVVLYELATGLHPHRNDDVSKLIHSILNEVPRRAGDVNPQLSPFFEEVIRTLITKERDARFASAAQVADILEAGEASEWWRERAAAMRIETQRPLRRIRIPRETALYGRDHDLKQLQTLFDKAKDGTGQVLLVEGEAGIGKTRLVDEFVGQLRQQGEDINFLFGSYPPGGAATAAGAFSEAYREQFGDVGLENALEDHLTITPLLIPAFTALLRGDAVPKGAESLTRDSVKTVFTHATRGLAAERPTIVLIDDLHFAPDDGRALFASLAHAVQEHRILLIGTLRPGVEREWIANVERNDFATKLELSRLGAKDLTSLLKDAFQSERLAQELGFRIAEKSDGNPFFAFEIIRGLREGQFITQTPDGAWVSSKIVRDIQIPSSVLELVNARVSNLTEAERDLLDVASCCGFEFDPLMLSEVTRMPRIPLLKRLGQIERQHRLVRASGRRFVFDHHQVQEALYAGLSDLLKEEYHAAIADALEVLSGARDKDPSELDGSVCVSLCQHFFRGAREKSALRYLEPALTHLAEGHLGAQLLALANHALAFPDLLEGNERIKILLKKNSYLVLIGRTEAQEKVLAECVALTKRVGVSRRVEIAMSRMHYRMGRNKEAIAHAHRAKEQAIESGDRMGESVAANALAIVYIGLSRYSEALDELEIAMAIAEELDDDAGVAISKTNLGIVYSHLGQSGEALAHMEQGLKLTRDCGVGLQYEANAMTNLAATLFDRGRYAEARTMYEDLLRITREIGAGEEEVNGTGNLACVLLAEGRSEDAIRLLERAIALAREVGHTPVLPVYLTTMGNTLMRLGSWEEALVSFQHALKVAKEVGHPALEAIAHAYLGNAWLEQGELVKSEDHFSKAISFYDGAEGGNSAASIARSYYGSLLIRLGRHEEARVQFETAMASASNWPTVRALCLVELASIARTDKAHLVEMLRSATMNIDSDAAIMVFLFLYQSTSEARYLKAAHDLLMDWVEHAPARYRETTITSYSPHRNIMKAWEKAQDEEATDAE